MLTPSPPPSPAPPSPLFSESRWKRTNLYATQISKGQNEDANGKDAADLNSDEEMDQLAKNDKERDQIQKERKASKQMEHQYWLEMCDSQHRYGTNLKVSLDPVLRFRQCFFFGGGLHADATHRPTRSGTFPIRMRSLRQWAASADTC